MRTIIALLLFALSSTAAFPFECKTYIDKEGYERWKCRYDTPLVNGETVEKKLKIPEKVSVTGASGPGGGFIYHDLTNNITKSCANMHGRIECY